MGFINFIGRIWVIIDAVHLPEQKRKPNEEIKKNIKTDDECCGAHEVCERDSLLSSILKSFIMMMKNLMSLQGSILQLIRAQRDRIAYVFYTLKESDGGVAS